MKWNDCCLAIRDAGNLAIEVGSQLVSTNSIIPRATVQVSPLDHEPFPRAAMNSVE